jgi:hypothetical protein
VCTLAAGAVWRLHGDAPVEAARAQQSRVEHIGAVGGAQYDHPGGRIESVHLGEYLVERLLALVVTAHHPAAAAAGPADRVELIDEDDRRGSLLGLYEEVANPRRPDADDRLDELRGRRREEGHSGLAGHGPRQQRLARSGRSG